MSAAPAAIAGLSLSGLTDLAARLGYLLPLAGVGAESAGLPVPGETTLLVSAVLAGDGRLAPWGVALAGFVGAVLGDNLGYWAARRFGMRLARLPVLRRLSTPDRLAAAERLSGGGRHAFTAIFLARSGRHVFISRHLPLPGGSTPSRGRMSSAVPIRC